MGTVEAIRKAFESFRRNHSDLLDRTIILCRSGAEPCVRSATLLDANVHGLRVRSEMFLKQGETVTVLLDTRDVQARVSCVKETDEGFEAGLEICAVRVGDA